MLLNCGDGEDTARTPNQSILKEINPAYSLEGLVLKLKFQSFVHLVWRADSLEKTLMLGKIEEKGAIEDEMVGWHHWNNRHEFEQTLGDTVCGVMKSWTRLKWLSSILFSTVAAPVSIPTSNVGGLSLLHTFSSIYYLHFLMMAILTQCEVIPHCSFNLHFSNN